MKDHLNTLREMQDIFVAMWNESSP